MKQLVFYGAGLFAQSNIGEFVNMGYEPVCFADADTNKHFGTVSTQDGKGFVILPLSEAINRYPDYELIVTVIKSSYAKVRDELIESGIEPDRINMPPFYNMPRDHIFTQLNKMLSDSIVKKIEIFEDHTEVIIDALRNNNPFRMYLYDFSYDVAMHCFWNKEYEGEETKMLSCILDCLPIDATIFDVGANVGYFSLCFGTWFPEMRIHAFEPISYNFEFLKKNTDLNKMDNVTVNNIGLYEKEQTAEFYFNEIANGAASMKNILSDEAAKKVQCELTTMDLYAEKTGVCVDFIKCDTEGSELFVLKGGIETLKKYNPVIISEIVHFTAFDYKQNDIVSFLAEIGYSCYIIDNGRLVPIEKITNELKKTNYIFIHSSQRELFSALM